MLFRSSMEAAVKSLVDTGVLTAEEGTAILETPSPRSETREERPSKILTQEQRTAMRAEMKSLMDQGIEKLVAKGTITQLEADQLLERSKGSKIGLDLTTEKMDAIQQVREDSMKTAVAKLVKDGVLTQAEADTILAKPIKELREKGTGIFQTLTEMQREALHKARQASFETAITALVEIGRASCRERL